MTKLEATRQKREWADWAKRNAIPAVEYNKELDAFVDEWLKLPDYREFDPTEAFKPVTPRAWPKEEQE